MKSGRRDDLGHLGERILLKRQSRLWCCLPLNFMAKFIDVSLADGYLDLIDVRFYGVRFLLAVETDQRTL